MKVTLLLLAAAATLGAGCQGTSSGNSATTGSDTAAAAATAPQPAAIDLRTPRCFVRAMGKDTAVLQLQASNDSAVTGQLEYRWFEKDRNKGALRGTLRNNIVEASYEFMSEGVTSTRPVVFRLEGEQAFEAIASSLDKDGQPVFDKDPALIRFDSIPFVAAPCP